MITDSAWADESDYEYHAPSVYVEESRKRREDMKRRDRTELKELWRDEQRRRRRERAPLFYRTAGK